MYTKRKILFKTYSTVAEQKKIYLYNESNRKVEDIDTFLKLFDTEKGAKSLWIYFSKIKLPISDPSTQIPYTSNEFFGIYCCDLEWAKNKNFCKSASTGGNNGGRGSTGSSTVKKTNTVGGTNTIGTTKKSKYTKCSEQLPIKQYCKNETIRKVQACLKMPKRYQTGNFGPITQEYLESRNQNGTLITTETIINICGANHPLVPGVPYSSVPKTGYEDYTVDEIEYSNDVQNTKPSTPSSEKPEGEGTGYEDYSEEKPQPASPSTPKSASSFSSEIPGLQSSKKSFTNRTMDSDEIEY